VTCAFSLRRAPDEEFWAEAVISSILGPDGGMTGYTVVLRDATAKHRYEEELVRLSTQDPLTGALKFEPVDMAEGAGRIEPRGGRPFEKAPKKAGGHMVGPRGRPRNIRHQGRKR
jgi:hypothetical protein